MRLVLLRPSLAALALRLGTIIASAGGIMPLAAWAAPEQTQPSAAPKIYHKGRNFRIGAGVTIGGNKVRLRDVKRVSLETIKVEVPGSLNQDSGEIQVIVTNPDGAPYAPATFTASGPEITSVKPAQLIAGESDVDLEILGQNFRGLSGVVISPNGGAGPGKTSPGRTAGALAGGASSATCGRMRSPSWPR